MIRAGLVGFGSIAEFGHLPALRAIGVDVVAVADLSPERVRRAREALPSARIYSSPLALIEDAPVDLLDICTPPASHADLIIAGCSRGLPQIVCEKPFVLSENDFIRVGTAAQLAGSRLTSVNNWLYSDLFRHVVESLSEYPIGSLREVELVTSRSDCALGSAGWMPRWRTERSQSGGGIVLDHGWHQLYLLLEWIRKPVREVRAVLRTADQRHAPVEDEAAVDLRFSDARARLELRWTADERSNRGVLRGTRGQILIHDWGIEIESPSGRLHRKFRATLTASSHHPDWFEAMFRCAVLDENRAAADQSLWEAGVVASLISAVYRSANEAGSSQTPRLDSVEAARAEVCRRSGLIDVYSSQGATGT